MKVLIVFGLKWFWMLSIALLLLMLFYKLVKVSRQSVREKGWKPFTIKVAALLAVMVLIKILSYNITSNNFSFHIKYNKDYIMDINETKVSSDGTSIRLDKALLDLNRVDFNIGVRGKDKLVAIELKKNVEDREPLYAMIGLWTGKRFSYEYSSYGIPCKSNEVISPLYVECYLSNGEELSFKIEDLKNVKNKTEVIEVNKNIKYNGKNISIKTLTRALNYSNLYVTTEENIFYTVEFEIVQNGKTIKSGSGSSGGGVENIYGFDPIEGKDIVIVCREKGTGEEIASVRIR